jgi:hypothetical protein
MDQEHEFVDEPAAHQRPGQIAAAEHDEVAARPTLQRRERVRGVALEQH